LAARVFSRRTGITVEIIPPSPHTEILKYFNLARISIGLSISDGLPASVLEAMAMGAFPIQSCTGCAQEWLSDGQTGLIVPPEDPDKVADAIRRALADDDLVDHAAEENTRLIAARLDKRIISPKIADIYQHIIQNRPAD
jgi:glycosyltransferase involved in cell wall biosynthesis